MPLWELVRKCSATDLALQACDAPGEAFMEDGSVTAWGADWAWGLPLIVSNVVFHVFGVCLINERVARRLSRFSPARYLTFRSAFVIGGTALAVTVLQSVEVLNWAVAYRVLGALPDNRSAMLYSLNAMTSYGHVDLYLEPRWQMMGALEALNGWILFGLTTAFLFTVVEGVWSHTRLEQSETQTPGPSGLSIIDHSPASEGPLTKVKEGL
jgi:hypothetical protein